MDELILFVVIFYIIPALCALIGFFRSGWQKAELEALRTRVTELEARLCAGVAASEPSVAEVPCAEKNPADEDFTELHPAMPAEAATPERVAQPEPVVPDLTVAVAPVPKKLVSEELVSENPAFQDPGSPQTKLPGVLVTLWEWFRANPILYIGLGVFLTGMAFALNFLTFHGYLTVELRLGAAGLVGAAFLGSGWKLWQRKPLLGLDHEAQMDLKNEARSGLAHKPPLGLTHKVHSVLVAQALMAGGAVILYLTLFMAARLQVLGTGPVFGGMALLVVGVTLLAVKVDAQLLAVLSTAGGFAVPVLLATETGNHIGLFSYYALLAAGNLLLLRFRVWDIPGLLSFAAVSLVGGLWAQDAYQPVMFPEMEGFLVLFFLIFSAMQLQLLRHAQAWPGWGSRLVHASYLFGLPLAAFGCQYLLTRPYPYADALSALALAAWHLALHRVYRKEGGPSFGLACDAFLILSVGFSALSVPLALHAPWITCTWALQGAGLVWLGLRQERCSLCRAGYTLQGLGLLDLLYNFPRLQTPVPGGLTNGFVIGVLALCLAGLVVLRELHRRQIEAETSREQQLAYTAAQGWAMGVWWLVVFFQIDCTALSHAFTEDQWFCCLALCTAVSAFIWFMAGLRWGLRLWQYPVQGLWLLLLVYLPCPEYWSGLLQPQQGAGLVESLEWADFSAPGVLLTIPMAHYAMQRAPELWRGRWLNVSLAALWLLTVFFAVYQWGFILYPDLTANPYAAFFWMLAPAAVLLGIMPRVLGRFARLPLYARSGATVYTALSCALLGWLGVVFVILCSYDGRTLGGYLPVFSWVDATQLLILASAAGLYTHFVVWRKKVRALLGFGLFILSTVVAARTVCAVTSIPYTLEALMHDPAFRFVLSVLWGGMALGLMLAASRLLKGETRRGLWFAGAALLLLTMLKLLLLDMADRSTVYRMVSFLSLGLLMLGMGYFCPLPPKAVKEPEPTATQG